MEIKQKNMLALVSIFGLLTAVGCTVKAVGDPKRPITIDAHITVDIKGLQNTATDIEDFVSGQKSKESLPVDQGGK